MPDEITITDLFNLLKNVKEENAQFHTQLKYEIKELKDVNKKIQIIENKNLELEEQNRKLTNKINIAERKLKKYNLVFYGIKGDDSDIEAQIISILNEKLEVICTGDNIRDIYRIGKTENENIRPVVVEFVNYKLKRNILLNASKLKGSEIYVSNDYTTEEYEKRKLLNKHLKLARQKNLNAKIKKNALIVNGEEYMYEDLKDKEILEDSISEILNCAETHKQPAKDIPLRTNSAQQRLFLLENPLSL